MPTYNILSLDVGVKHCGYVLYSVPTRDIHHWGVCEMPLQSSSYLSAVQNLKQRICLDYNYVVIERQLHGKNIQTSRLEATLEGFFGAEGVAVHLMPATRKLTDHGLQLTPATAKKITDREAAAKERHRRSSPTSTADVSKQQQTRLNKSRAIDLCKMFLEENKQSATMHRTFNNATKKDDMADALLQALTFVNMYLH